MKETFAIRLKRAMNIRNINQSELCNKTNIPKSAISQYLSGAFKPKQDRVNLLSKVLNINPAWLMGYDVHMENTNKSNIYKLSPDELKEISKNLGIPSNDLLIFGNNPPKELITEYYLKSLGYAIDSVYAKEENGKWIEVEYKQFDENGKLQLPPNLKQKTKISKGDRSVIITNEEFKELQDNIENIANYEIDKLFKNKG